MDKSNGKVLEELHCELHLLQHCASQEPIGVAERFENLKVVVPRDIDAVGISVKVMGVLIHPCDGAAHLLSQRQQASAHVLHSGEV